MTTRILIKNDESSQHATIVHFSNDSATRLLKPGESVDAALYQGMNINLIESEEDYSHGESESEPVETPVQEESAPALVDIPLEFKGE